MDRLYSDDPLVREEEAAKYRIFHKKVSMPRRWKRDWDSLLGGRDINRGNEWPDGLLRVLRTRKWPEYTFGTANAACLVVWHRPGDTNVNVVEETFLSPSLPVLGGIPHAHNALWYPKYSSSQTWRSLHRFLVPALARLENPWSQVMTTCLTTIPAKTGVVDSRANLQAVNNGLLQFMLDVCQPRVVLLCGGAVQKASAHWNPPPDIVVVECTHPSFQHWSGDGPRVREVVEKTLFS